MIQLDHIPLGQIQFVDATHALCSTGAPLRIDDVVAAHPTGGMHVVDWGVRNTAPSTPVRERTSGQIAETDLDPQFRGPVSRVKGYGRFPVRAACRDAVHTRFVVELATTRARGTMTGLTLRYAGGQHLFDQLAVAICTADCPPLTRSEGG